jgi:hypothetical protein
MFNWQIDSEAQYDEIRTTLIPFFGESTFPSFGAVGMYISDDEDGDDGDFPVLFHEDTRKIEQAMRRDEKGMRAVGNAIVTKCGELYDDVKREAAIHSTSYDDVVLAYYIGFSKRFGKEIVGLLNGRLSSQVMRLARKITAKRTRIQTRNAIVAEEFSRKRCIRRCNEIKDELFRVVYSPDNIWYNSYLRE